MLLSYLLLVVLTSLIFVVVGLFIKQVLTHIRDVKKYQSIINQ